MKNGGEGTIDSDIHSYNDNWIIEANNFTKKDHTFTEWTNNSNG